MDRLVAKIAGLVAVALPLIAFCGVEGFLREGATRASYLEASPQSLYFGSVNKGEIVPFHVTVTNRENIPVTLTDIQRTCGCTEAALPSHITVDVHDRGIYGKKSTIELKSLDGVLARQDLAFNYDGDQKITLSYVPTEAGDVDGKIILLPLPDEASQDNNQVDAKFQVGKAP